ncbi:MAG: endonuclease/exonuclease/phosphatase family protein [Anaerolineaceae bacterium]|nr:MAG: endonuclease/exonuclease/phosphatase family protein [Anaerolineaceae bacterium]
MKERIKNTIRRYVIALVWVYYTLLFLWAALYFVTGDRYGIVAIVNSLALYIFLPLPLILPLAIIFRRRELWIGLAGGVMLFIWLWGGLFIPHTSQAHTEGQPLSVMTYNVLGTHQQTTPAIEVIRTEDADVVFIQEINTNLAKTIEEELSDQYPYQVLDPYDDVTGMGTISKFPIHPTGETLPLKWVGVPQILSLDWHGQDIILINFHMWATGLAPPKIIAVNYRAREAQALFLADFARVAAYEDPVIVAGDGNFTDLSDAYKLVTNVLIDSWREAGLGFGHTTPGCDRSGGSRPHFYGIPVPRWLVRIDYIFHSNHFASVEARLAQFDGVSDHRGVIAELLLEK